MSVVIDNCFVSKMCDNGIRICSIRWALKMNPNLNIDSFPKLTWGSSAYDNFMIDQLADGLMKFDELPLR